MANGNEDSWHKGSRFWNVGTQALYMAGSFVYLAGGFRPQFVQEAIGAFTLIAGLLLGGGTWVNVKERDNAKAQIQATGDSDVARIDAGGG